MDVPNWFHRYSGPDILVGVAQETMNTLEAKLGIPAGQQLRMTKSGSGFDVAYLQLSDDLMLSASCIQLMSLKPSTPHEQVTEDQRRLRNMILAYVTSQRMDRPIVSHVQALSTPTSHDIDLIVELLRSRAVPHLTMLGNVYIGLREDDTGRIWYDRDVDAGTLLEFAPTFSTNYPGFIAPPELSDPPEVATVARGSMVRLTARTQLVQSANAVIARFQEILDWPSEEQLTYREGDGYRSVTIHPMNKLSAVWEIIEPTTRDGRAGRTLGRYGEGPWTIRIGVFGLDDKLDDLKTRGTRFESIDDGPNGRRVALNRWDLRGVALELEDLPVVHRGVGGGRT